MSAAMNSVSLLRYLIYGMCGEGGYQILKVVPRWLQNPHEAFGQMVRGYCYS